LEGILSDTRGSSVPLPFETFEPVVDEMVAFLAVASIVDGEAKLSLVEEAVNLFDNTILPAVRESLQEPVLSMLELPPVDALEIVECLGADAVAETVAWAVNVLTGVGGPRPEALDAFAACIEWDAQLSEAADDIVASAVIYTLVSAVNMMLANLVQ